ncbi:hypothetical protein T4E_8030 [Trichinella pseudospiralis]|uniref:Uncharacterized protein n=1 Tax=Trichinella pseudospiralis TaxID=6337 RepID=A0A0V0Y930_TRIPS|nr:hypothetical protein T4E_8030 [Trichinella pseudospiralis]
MRGNLKLRSGFKAWSKILTKQSAIADSPAADSRYKLKVPKKPRAAGNTQSPVSYTHLDVYKRQVQTLIG